MGIGQCHSAAWVLPQQGVQIARRHGIGAHEDASVHPTRHSAGVPTDGEVGCPIGDARIEHDLYRPGATTGSLVLGVEAGDQRCEKAHNDTRVATWQSVVIGPTSVHEGLADRKERFVVSWHGPLPRV